MSSLFQLATDLLLTPTGDLLDISWLPVVPRPHVCVREGWGREGGGRTFWGEEGREWVWAGLQPGRLQVRGQGRRTRLRTTEETGGVRQAGKTMGLGQRYGIGRQLGSTHLVRGVVAACAYSYVVPWTRMTGRFDVALLVSVLKELKSSICECIGWQNGTDHVARQSQGKIAYCKGSCRPFVLHHQGNSLTASITRGFQT